MDTLRQTLSANVSRTSLEDSYLHCRRVAKERAQNFYYSFLLLEAPQRDAMCAIYAFMRRCDDLSDDPAISHKAQVRCSIADWRMHLDRALMGDVEGDPIWPAFADSVARYRIPHRYFHEMIDGILSDLEPCQMQTFEQLYRYCYHVASVVGLTVIHIFGFRSPRALLLAEKCGIAFQLTNILRDVREDASMHRIYLPLEDLSRFGVPVEQLRSGTEDDRFCALMAFEAARARAFYAESASLIDLIEPKSRRSLWALRAIYLRLLSKIEANQYAVLSRRISVAKPVKIGLLLRAFLPK
ncbi:MAG: phytoene/squalene synthase family protein [Acidobacteriaceae bacterium]|nr:phytoene/squalene synthase family protein [Acidobacteriaceae bacterium]